MGWFVFVMNILFFFLEKVIKSGFWKTQNISYYVIYFQKMHQCLPNTVSWWDKGQSPQKIYKARCGLVSMVLPQDPGPQTRWVCGASSAPAAPSGWGPSPDSSPGKAMGFPQVKFNCHCSLKLQSEGIAPLLRDNGIVFIFYFSTWYAGARCYLLSRSNSVHFSQRCPIGPLKSAIVGIFILSKFANAIIRNLFPLGKAGC